MNFARISSLVRYLSCSEAPYKWRLNGGNCPYCGTTIYLSLGKNPWLNRCLRCKATLTNLSLIPVIQRHCQGEYKNKTVYELSSYGTTLNWLLKTFSEVVYSEYFPGKVFGVKMEGIQNEDVQNLTFQGGSFDIVTSNQVFEHVPNDQQGFSECARVLKKGGALIFSVPLHRTEQTMRIAHVVNGQIMFLGAPEYHDSRIAGAKSSPVFWHHSVNDIASRVRACGFSSAEVVDVNVSRTQTIPCKVVWAVK